MRVAISVVRLTALLLGFVCRCFCQISGVADTPTSVITLHGNDTADSVTLLGPWTGWSGQDNGQLMPTLSGDFSTDICKAMAICRQNRNLYLIHIVDWNVADGDIGIVSGNWFLFRYDTAKGKSTYLAILTKDKNFPDLYDIDNGFLITVSRLRIGPEEILSDSLQPPDFINAITTTQITPAWLSGLQTLIGGLAGPTIGGSKMYSLQKPEKAGTSVFRTTVTLQQFSPTSLKRPFTAAVTATASGIGAGSGDCHNMTAKAQCTFQANVSVDQREFVTFGIDIVPHGPAERIYTTATDGTVSSKVTNHNAFYAVVDFTPFPRKMPMDKYPYLQGGLPLSGAAMHLPYVGGAYPFPWFRNQLAISVFAGAIFMQQQGPRGGRDRATKLLWGLEVPITSFSSAISKVTGDKKSGSN
ncbi:MAG: hypothetical protein ACYCOU_14205 [Sulfobacillus sp.]